MRARFPRLQPWFAGPVQFVIRTAPASPDWRRLAYRLPAVASHASCLAVGHVIPCTALADGHNVVRVHLASRCYSPTINALPGTPSEHSLTPPSVCLVAVPTRRRIGPSALVTPCGRTQTQRPVGWDALRHQLFSITTPAVPVLFVVAETIFRNSVPNTSSGSE